MRKNDLIKKLQEIKGNPEVMLWNGLVADFVPIGNMVGCSLVKQTLEHYLEMCRLQRCKRKDDWDFQFSVDELQEYYQSYKQYIEWEENRYITEDDIVGKRYKKKNILAIDAKITGKTAHDRMGNISY